MKHDRRRAATPMGHVGGPLKRKCPRCQAPPGFKCRRVRAAKVAGMKAGEDGSYIVDLKYFHRERRNPEGKIFE